MRTKFMMFLVLILLATQSAGAENSKNWEVGQKYQAEISIKSTNKRSGGDLTNSDKTESSSTEEYKLNSINKTAMTYNVDEITGNQVTNSTESYNGTIAGIGTSIGLIVPNYFYDHGQWYLVGLFALLTPPLFVDFEGYERGFQQGLNADRIVYVNYGMSVFNVTLQGLLDSLRSWKINSATSLKDVSVESGAFEITTEFDGQGSVYGFYTPPGLNRTFVAYDQYMMKSKIGYDRLGVLTKIEYSLSSKITEGDLTSESYYEYKLEFRRRTFINSLPGFDVMLSISAILMLPILRNLSRKK